MKRTNIYNWAGLTFTILLIIAVSQTCVFAQKTDWQKEQVDWRMSVGSRIKSITYPKEKPPLTRTKMTKPIKPRRKQLTPDPLRRIEFLTAGAVGSVYAGVIDSPPVDGFVPYIAVTLTDKRGDELELEAVIEDSIFGDYLADYPESDYAIGIYDTGASAHVMGYEAATRAGLFNGNPNYVTNNPVLISGVTGQTEALVSQPIGIFICDLGAIEPNGFLWDRSSMMGQSNVAIAVGQGGDPVDLPTAIGSPMSAYYTAVFYNDTQITVNHNDINYTAPDIRIYQQDDAEIPNYANTIPLELRPLGSISAQYIPGFNDEFEIEPFGPSILTGTSSQSIFFVASVDLYNNGHSAIDKTRFMLDTGAQISVVGSRIGARLALNPAEPDFEVEVQGVTGDINIVPGFYIDSIDIPALGDWLSFTNIPVILLDIPSPEGGTVDGIIGMNLFADLNFVLRGGGLFLEDDPAIEYEPISKLRGDIAPPPGDGVVDELDLAALAGAWLANPLSQNWNPRADIVGDAIIDFHDFAALAQNWLEQP